MTVKNILKRPYQLFSTLFFDPRTLVNKIRAAPFFFNNWRRYRRANTRPSLRVRASELHYCTNERFVQAGSAQGHYFHQDIWAARHVYSRGVKHLVDVGSRVDGFIGHVLPFCNVCYVDLRPLTASVPGMEFRQGSILALPFATDSVEIVTCLHVIEHIGLGRYGDPINPEGSFLAARELCRVLKPGGILLIGTPVGRERLCFDAHRIFDPATVVEMFHGLQMEEFSLVNDEGLEIILNTSFEKARRCSYGCGLFVFRK
jgi:SAM-dependent methyltransferase